MDILVQVICHWCRQTMKLDGSNQQGNTFTCRGCQHTVTVKFKMEEVQ